MDRIEALRARHAALDEQLQSEIQRPLPRSEEVSRLKRAKLQLKDEMARLSGVEDTTH